MATHFVALIYAIQKHCIDKYGVVQLDYHYILPKAFDTVSHDGLWKIMTEYGCPPIVWQFHVAYRHVQNDGYTEPFPVTNGVK